MIDLAGNLNNLGTPPGLINLLEQRFSQFISTYGDQKGSVDMRKIDSLLQIPLGSAMITSGATHGIQILAEIINEQTVITLSPTFWEYEFFNASFPDRNIINIDAFSANVYMSIDTVLQNNSSGVVYICNPNNPTASIISKKDLLSLVKKYPEIKFVVDETYLWFCMKYKSISLIRYAPNYANLYVVTSLSKMFSIPGIRIGLIISCSNNINLVKKKVTPYLINTMQIKSAEYLLENESDFIRKTQLNTQKNAQRITNILTKHSINYLPTSTNFILIYDSTHSLAKQLFGAGIKVREGVQFGLDYSQYVRIKLWNKELDEIIFKILLKTKNE